MSLFTDLITSPTTWLCIGLFFAAGEGLLFVKEKKGVQFECLAAVVLWLFASRIGYLYGQDSWWVNETRLVDFSWMNVLIFAMPLFALLIANELITKIEAQVSKHIILFGVSVIIWPLFIIGYMGFFVSWCIVIKEIQDISSRAL